MTDFIIALKQSLRENLKHNYGIENYDAQRFGAYHERKVSFFQRCKNQLKKLPPLPEYRIQSMVKNIEKFHDGLNALYQNLSADDRGLMVQVVAYRILGFRHVKLPLNNPTYFAEIKKAAGAIEGAETIDLQFKHYLLHQFHLKPFGYDIRLFFTAGGIVTDFVLEQYAYYKNGESLVKVKKGDTVLDVGACWGDTALYFAANTGAHGKVFSFEFIPNNISLFEKNIGLNPHVASNIELLPFPLGETSGTPVYYKDNGPGSRVALSPFAEQTGKTETLCIDDFVARYGVDKVDFIKMDIEGAELPALKGAVETIKKYKPQLAIAIYHSMEDFTEIPTWITGLGLGYQLYLGHYTMYGEETVIFAKPAA